MSYSSIIVHALHAYNTPAWRTKGYAWYCGVWVSCPVTSCTSNAAQDKEATKLAVASDMADGIPVQGGRFYQWVMHSQNASKLVYCYRQLAICHSYLAQVHPCPDFHSMSSRPFIAPIPTLNRSMDLDSLHGGISCLQAMYYKFDGPYLRPRHLRTLPLFLRRFSPRREYFLSRYRHNLTYRR